MRSCPGQIVYAWGFIAPLPEIVIDILGGAWYTEIRERRRYRYIGSIFVVRAGAVAPWLGQRCKRRIRRIPGALCIGSLHDALFIHEVDKVFNSRVLGVCFKVGRNTGIRGLLRLCSRDSISL